MLAEVGENRLEGKKEKSIFLKFLDQLKDVMILILLAAAVVSFIIACVNHAPGEFFEPILILLIVILNAVLGLMQESRAEKALKALQDMSAPRARVIRDGAEQVIDAALLVPGDLISLEAGDFIPADARLVACAGLKTDESSLTGESLPSEKNQLAAVSENAPLGDRTNMVYSGTSATYGTAKAIVTATGMGTEMGKIADLLNREKTEQTPLQAKLAVLGKYLGIVALVACAVIFVIGVIDKIPLLQMFMVSVSLAVSAIPEGLPAIVTVILSIGVQRMVRKNAIIRRLSAVETLGGASVICSDKTGTLTQNRMTITACYTEGAEEAEAYSKELSQPAHSLLRLAVLCCDANIIFSEGGERHIGDPTETAILKAAHEGGIDLDALRRDCPRLAELPFDSDRKLMTSVNSVGGQTLVIVKGAFDILRDRCISGSFEKAEAANLRMSREALRVLAVAYKIIDTVSAEPSPAELEDKLHFIGLLGMIDPPRPEARDAVALCRKAGIKPVMITGDHIVTASAIASQLDILRDGDAAITGTELAVMSDEALQSRVETISVYARVTPTDKIRIVKAWQLRDAVVSMTGDGVNDAPALKAADIGCAMGITGTDVAKGAADMVLTDDNFATIVSAVREGRGIYENIRKVVGYLLGTNIGEVLTVFIAMLISRESPLLSIHLLWINLVTDSIPAIALGMEPVERGVMDKPPRPKNEGIFAGGMGLQVALMGCMFAAVTLAGYYIGRAGGDASEGRTMAFMILALTQIVQSFNMRSSRSLFQVGLFTNDALNKAALTSVLLVALLLFIQPLAAVFSLSILPFWMYLVALLLALLPLPVIEIVKALGLFRI